LIVIGSKFTPFCAPVAEFGAKKTGELTSKVNSPMVRLQIVY
jgi:hypothetical protein